MKYDLDIRSIKNFVMVAEMGSISHAAERLHLAQPTLSRQISGLEARLHMELLDRTKNGIGLTEMGKVFLQRCKKLEKEYDEFLGWAYGFQSVVVGTLNIAHQKVNEAIVIDYHSKFLNAYPNVTIKNYRPGKEHFMSGLLSGELDAAYNYSNELRNSYKCIKSLQVGALRNMLLVSQNNPISKRDRVHLSELKDQPFVLPSRANAPNVAEDNIKGCEACGFTPRVVGRAETMLEWLLEIVRHNGVAIFPYY